MDTLPPQNEPVFRDPLARDRPDDADDVEPGVAALTHGGVLASQSRCDHLTGPARSMCYATLYGVSV
jgi:hypothetical protein